MKRQYQKNLKLIVNLLVIYNTYFIVYFTASEIIGVLYAICNRMDHILYGESTGTFPGASD